MKVIIAFIIVSAIICIYGAEATLDYLSSGELTWETTPGSAHGLALSPETMVEHMKVAKEIGQPFDGRSHLEVIRDFEGQGVQAYPPVTVNKVVEVDGKELFPLGGISNVVTVYCNEVGEYTIYNSDEHGFHNPKGLWNRGPIEIAVLGDSFTHGACVPSDENFVARIRAYHPRTLNLGMAGMTPLHQLGTLKEYVSMVRPQLVLWVYFEGTRLDELRQEERGLLGAYVHQGPFQELFLQQLWIDRALIKTFGKVHHNEKPALSSHTMADGFVRLLELEALRSYVNGVLYAGEAPSTNAGLGLFKKVLREAVRTTRMWKGQFMFVYLPQYERYTHPWLANSHRQRVLSIVAELGITVIDVHPAFASQPDPISLFPFRRAGHYDVLGHQVVADTILSHIGHDSRVSE